MAQTGYTPIQLYYSTTASAVPLAANLAAGELAINTVDGKLYFKNSAGTVTLLAGSGGGGPAAGSNTQIQFNNSGVFGASSSLTWDGTYLTAGSIKDSALTSGRVTFAGASGLLTDSANLTFNGTTLTANTIGAFTLGGTIAGGGNQINNVIIGTTTPLAGSFTTLSATGLITGRSTNGQVFTSTNSVDSTFSIDISSGKVTISQLASAGTLDTVIGSTTRTSVSSTGFAVTGTLSSTLDATIYGLTVGRGAGAVSTNTAVGVDALSNGSQSGARNTSLGFRASYLNTSGENITAVGAYALYSNDTGSNNTGVGYGTLDSNTSGSNNVGVGVGTLQANTTASNNTAVGYQAGYAVNGAGGITAVGASAIGVGNSAYNTTAIGCSALNNNGSTGYSNTAVGAYAMSQNTSGRDNVAMGSDIAGVVAEAALSTNTSGSKNVAIGNASLGLNLSGSNNVALGYMALYTNSTASNNTAVGYQAAYSNTTGGPNTAVGYQSAYSVTVNGPVTAIGYQAGKTYNAADDYGSVFVGYLSGTLATGKDNVVVGGSALKTNSSGAYNTALGAAALYSNTTASNNTAVGYQAGYSGTVGGYSTHIGYQAGYASNFTSDSFANNTFVGALSGSAITTGRKNTILGLYTGNQNGLDIRTANNYIVLSDGDGNPRAYWDSYGNASLAGGVSPTLNTDLGGAYTLAYGYRGTAHIAYAQANHIQTVNAYYQGGWKRGGSGAPNYLQIAGGAFIFASADSGATDSAITWTEVLRVQKDQTIPLQGGATSVSGTGITFPATQNASSNANTLDDYEEGTWTPAISGLTLGNGTASGQYTKVGNSVSVQFKITLGSTSSVTSLITLSGLPFSISGFFSSYVDVLDAGTIQYSAVVSTYGNSSTADIRGLRSNGTYVDSYIMDTTAPMTWTDSDSVTASFTYRAS